MDVFPDLIPEKTKTFKKILTYCVPLYMFNIHVKRLKSVSFVSIYIDC